jgi:DNA-binding protein HU-beta
MAAKKATKAKAPKKPMNRAELCALVAKELGESNAGADRAIAAVMNGIKRGLKKQGKVSLVGFGSFEVRKRGARKGRNPQTGEQIRIKASKSVGFKAGAPLKAYL